MQKHPFATGTIAPWRIAVIASLLWIALFLLAPVVIDVSYSASAVVMLLACIGGAFVGMGLASLGKRKPVVSFGIGWCRLARRIIGLGLAGLVLLVVDRYIIRGVPIGFDIFESRAALEEEGSGPLSVVAALLVSFVPFGPVATWVASAMGEQVSRRMKVISWAALAVSLLMAASLGSRSLVMVCAFLYLFAFAWLRAISGEGFRIRYFFVLAAGATLLVSFLAWLMLYRLGLMELSAIESIQVSAYSYTLKPSPVLLDILAANGDFEAGGAVLYSVLVYVLHGIFEFLVLFDNFEGPYTYGAVTLWLPLKLLSQLLPLTEAPNLDFFEGVRTGVFTSFAGPSIVDAGLAAPILLAVKFFLLCQPYRLLAQGDLRWLFAALIVAATVAVAPMIDLLDSAAGAYPLVAALIIVVISPRPTPSPKRATDLGNGFSQDIR